MWDTMTRHIFFPSLFFFFVCFASAQNPASTLDLEHSQLLDLTYSFDQNTVYWPTADGFKWTKD